MKGRKVGRENNIPIPRVVRLQEKVVVPRHDDAAVEHGAVPGVVRPAIRTGGLEPGLVPLHGHDNGDHGPRPLQLLVLAPARLPKPWQLALEHLGELAPGHAVTVDEDMPGRVVGVGRNARPEEREEVLVQTATNDLFAGFAVHPGPDRPVGPCRSETARCINLTAASRVSCICSFALGSSVGNVCWEVGGVSDVSDVVPNYHYALEQFVSIF
jgi:hypothetical protein